MMTCLPRQKSEEDVKQIVDHTLRSQKRAKNVKVMKTVQKKEILKKNPH